MFTAPWYSLSPMAMACADGKSPSFCPLATATSVVGLALNAAVQRSWARSCRAATSKASRTADLSASGCRRQRLDTLASALRGARRVERGGKRVLDRWHARPTAARTAERTHWSRAGAPYATKVSMGAQRTSSQESRAHLHEQLLGQHNHRRRFGLACFSFLFLRGGEPKKERGRRKRESRRERERERESIS